MLIEDYLVPILPVKFYFDHNVNRAVAQGLRLRGVDVLTAIEDGSHQRIAPRLLYDAFGAN